MPLFAGTSRHTLACKNQYAPFKSTYVFFSWSMKEPFDLSPVCKFCVRVCMCVYVCVSCVYVCVSSTRECVRAYVYD
jgi:hypothetical protein